MDRILRLGSGLGAGVGGVSIISLVLVWRGLLCYTNHLARPSLSLSICIKTLSLSVPISTKPYLANTSPRSNSLRNLWVLLLF